MERFFIDQIYDTLIGVAVGYDAVPGVENAFAEGSFCDRKDDEVYKARAYLENILTPSDNMNVDLIHSNMNDIQHELCIQMFRLGVRFGAEMLHKPN